MNRISITYLFVLLLWSCNNEAIEQMPEIQACDNGIFLGTVILETQQDVDDFAIQCYTKIEGSLFIGPPQSWSTDIIDLSGLEHIIEVFPGRLYIASLVLNSLSGLHNIEKLGGLTITNNEELTNLNGLNGLQQIGDLNNTTQNNITIETLKIYNNLNLISLEGLNNLNAAEGIEIYGNPNLLNLNGLESLNNLISPYGTENSSFQNALQVGYSSSCQDACAANYNLKDLCALQNLFINGSYDPNNIRLNVNISDQFPILDILELSVQDIIDGNCSF